MKIMNWIVVTWVGVVCAGGVSPIVTAADGPDVAGLRSPVLMELLSDCREVSQILYAQEANLIKTQFSKDPGNAKLAFKTARLLMSGSGHGVEDPKMWAEAKDVLTKGLALDPNNARGWFQLGSWYLNETCLEDARRCFEKARDLGANKKTRLCVRKLGCSGRCVCHG